MLSGKHVLQYMLILINTHSDELTSGSRDSHVDSCDRGSQQEDSGSVVSGLRRRSRCESLPARLRWMVSFCLQYYYYNSMIYKSSRFNAPDILCDLFLVVIIM